MLLRRSEDFAAPGKPTKFGTAYLNDGGHDVNGQFLNGGGQIRLFIAPTTAAVMPGTLTGRQIDAKLDFADIYNLSGMSGRTPVTMSRFDTRFAAIFERVTAPRGRRGTASTPTPTRRPSTRCSGRASA